MDLSLVPLEELCNEIMNRGSHGIVYIYGKGENRGYYNWIGHPLMCYGLCIEMINKIRQEAEEED